MKKKILAFVFILTVLNVTTTNAFAADAQLFSTQYDYRNGYFDNNSNYTTDTPELIDNIITNGKPKGTIIFNKEEKINLLGIYVTLWGGAEINFYDANDNKTASLTVPSARYWREAYQYYTLPNVKVKKLVVASTDVNPIREFEMFVGEVEAPVAALKVDESYTKAIVSWANPSKAHYSKKIYLNNVLVKEIKDGSNSYELTNLKSNEEYEVKVVVHYGATGEEEGLPASMKFKTKKFNDLADLKVSDIKHNSATLIYKLPEGAKSLEIYDEKNKLIDTTTNKNAYVINNLQGETNYTYTVRVVYENGETSEKQQVKFATVEADREVLSLTATSTAADVSLKWKMPTYKALDVARIYRQKEDAGTFARMFRSASTYEPIFETNGTTFKDLTVKADTEYTYKVTTVDTTDNETDGKTVKIRTKKMNVSGGGTEKDENGDYVITWTSPTTGKIKVLVGGKEYKIVQASDKKIVIPKDKMVFDIIGKPDVKLIPIDDDGNEGTPSKPGGTGNGGGIGDIVGGSDLAETLSPENILKSGMSLFVLIGAILLLRLSFVIVPKLIRLIRNAISKKHNVYERRGVKEW